MDKINDYTKLLDKSYYYAKQNNVTKLLEVANKMISTYKDDDIRYFIITYYYKNKEYQTAINYIKPLLKNKNYVSRGLEALCACYYEMRDYASFKNVLDRLKKEDIGFYYLHAIKFLCYVKNDIKSAEKIIKDAIVLKDDKAKNAVLVLAKYLDMQKDYARAFKYMKMLDELYDSRVWLRIGQYYLNGLGVKKDVNKAIRYFLKADNRVAHETLGKILATDRDNDELAIYHFLRAIQLGDISSYLGLGIIYGDSKSKYYSLKNHDECFTKYFRLTKGNEKVYDQITNYVNQYIKNKKKKEELEYYMKKYWGRGDLQA